MRDDDGRKLDHATLEAMRLRAVKRIEAGARVEDVASSLGLSRSTVFAWMAAYREGGERALAAKPVPGRPPKLSGTQLRTLYTLISGSDPRQFQLEFALWTRELVQQLIWTQFKIRLSVVSVGRVLRTLGLSPQRPVFRATQQDPERVKRWRESDYPAIRAEAAQVGGMIYFADEAGIRSDYHSGTTWAPVGQTPVVTSTGARYSLNMISAVTPKGRLRFSTFTGSMNTKVFLDFVKRLMHDEPNPVFLILTATPFTGPRPSRPSSIRPRAGCGCSSSRPTRPSSTRTNGCGRTSSTTASAKPASAPPRISKPRPNARYGDCNDSPDWYARSSPTHTSDTPARSSYFRSPW